MIAWIAPTALLLLWGISHLAARFSQETGFHQIGKLVEADPTGEIVNNPRDTRTQDFITGRFG